VRFRSTLIKVKIKVRGVPQSEIKWNCERILKNYIWDVSILEIGLSLANFENQNPNISVLMRTFNFCCNACCENKTCKMNSLVHVYLTIRKFHEMVCTWLKRKYIFGA